MRTARPSLLTLFSVLTILSVQAVQDGFATDAITAEGQNLVKKLDDLDVEHRWLPGFTIEWKSGKSLNPVTEKGVHTHCSAFAASACDQLNIPLLSPPPQGNLANRQADWLLDEGQKKGWKLVNATDAQNLANHGVVVVASFKNTDANYHGGHGHIAVIRPSNKSVEAIQKEGPQITQAGGHNYNSAPLSDGFAAKIRPLVKFFAFQPN